MSNRKLPKQERDTVENSAPLKSVSPLEAARNAAALDNERLQTHLSAIAEIQNKLDAGLNDLVEAEETAAAVSTMAARVLDERNKISTALSGMPMGEAFLARNRVLAEYDNLRWKIAEVQSSIRVKAEGMRLRYEADQRVAQQKQAEENQRLFRVARDMLRNPNSVDPNTGSPWTSDGVDALIKALQNIAEQQSAKMKDATSVGEDPLAEDAEVSAAREAYVEADQERRRIAALIERLIERRDALVTAENSPERAKQYAEAIVERDACVQLIQADYRALVRDLKALLTRVDRCNQIVAYANQNRPRRAEFLLRPEHIARKVLCGTTSGPVSILDCRLVDIDALN